MALIYCDIILISQRYIIKNEISIEKNKKATPRG